MEEKLVGDSISKCRVHSSYRVSNESWGGADASQSRLGSLEDLRHSCSACLLTFAVQPWGVGSPCWLVAAEHLELTVVLGTSL